jgi:hypothetical protein
VFLLDAGRATFLSLGMKKAKRLPDQVQQQLLDGVRVELATAAQIPRMNQLLSQHHYLGSLRPVGQRLYYVARNAAGQWVALLVFSAAAKHLKHRDEWIGWSEEQRRRRLSLVTNNSRFLLLPDFSVPNLGSRVLRLTLARLREDWQTRYGHPVEVGFPMAKQAARLLRQTQGRKDEEVALITIAPLPVLPAMLWLQLNRKGWGIESGLHQRLDVSYNDDRCRVQSNNGIWVLGMFRRLANSLFVQWSTQQRRPEQVTTTTFQTVMAENHRAAAMRFVLSKRPSLKNLS